MPKISVLLPSAYPEKRAKFLKSLKEKSANYDSFEIIVVLDGDMEDWRDGNILYTYREPTNYRTKFFEHAYRKSTCDWIWLANDDLEIETQDWDTKFELGNDPWRMYYFRDNNYNGQFACHPLTSRKIWELMDEKGLVFPKLVNMGCDTTIWDVIPFQKRFYKPEIELIHNRFLDANKQREIELDYQHYHGFRSIREEVKLEIIKHSNLIATKVLIGVPTAEVARKAEFYAYLNSLDRPGTVLTSTAIGQSPAKGRNILIQQAVDNECTHIFFLDDDVLPPPMALSQLLTHEKMVVSGLYLHRNFPHKPLIFDYVDENGKNMYHFLSDGEKGLIEITNAGLGCCLINMEVFKLLERPYIRLGEIDGDEWNDDIGFFNRVRKAGVKMYADLDIKCGHIATVALWPHQDEKGIWYTQYDSQGTSRVALEQIKGLPLEERLKMMEEEHASV